MSTLGLYVGAIVCSDEMRRNRRGYKFVEIYKCIGRDGDIFVIKDLDGPTKGHVWKTTDTNWNGNWYLKHPKSNQFLDLYDRLNVS